MFSPRSRLHPIIKMEGGTVYHSDSWSTQDTATGEYCGGQL